MENATTDFPVAAAFIMMLGFLVVYVFFVKKGLAMLMPAQSCMKDVLELVLFFLLLPVYALFNMLFNHYVIIPSFSWWQEELGALLFAAILVGVLYLIQNAWRPTQKHSDILDKWED